MVSTGSLSPGATTIPSNHGRPPGALLVGHSVVRVAEGDGAERVACTVHRDQGDGQVVAAGLPPGGLDPLLR